MPSEQEVQPHPSITLAKGAIHRPDEPRHFMKLKPVSGKVRILLGDQVLAVSTNAMRLIEVGFDLYDPVFYLPIEDVVVELDGSETSTVCPLKGKASYHSLPASKGQEGIADIAWSYPDPYDFAKGLDGLIAFYPSKVTVEESPQ